MILKNNISTSQSLNFFLIFHRDANPSLVPLPRAAANLLSVSSLNSGLATMQERRECEVEILFFNFTRTRTSISSHSSATSCQICFFFECRQCRREGNVGRMFALQHHPSKRPPYRPLQLIMRGGIGWEKGMKKKTKRVP